MKKYYFIESALEKHCGAKNLCHSVYTVIVLLCGGIIIGLLSMYFGAADFLLEMFLTYFNNFYTPLLNILPVILLIFLLYFITNRVWLSFSLTSILLLGMSLVNYYKILLRDDPFLPADLTLFAEANTIMERYTVTLNWKIVTAVLLCLIIAVLLFFFARQSSKSGKGRLIGIVAILLLGAVIYPTLYTSETLYKKTENLALISQWSDTGQYISRGFVYPFLYAIQSSFEKPPEGYDEKEAAQILQEYDYDDIPGQEKIAVFAVMCEAFNDFSQFDTLTFADDIYAPYHELEAKSYHGHLITNVFGGGTVDTEWCFLTGFSCYRLFRTDTNSYVRYFDEQGYYTEGGHPSYEWFYNRVNVNEYLGFADYFFYENRFETENGSMMRDDLFFADLQKRYEAFRADSAQPYFSFNVTYQNHGPYSETETLYDHDYIVNNGYSDKAMHVMNNYFAGIENTVMNICAMSDYLDTLEEPAVLIIFGDHNPWMGDASYVYREAGVDFDFSNNQGFYNYYETPYLIYANNAAKEALDNDFVGQGEDISPCFLMNELFEQAGWSGNEFIKLSDEMKKVTPLLHTTGLFVQDGVLTDRLKEKNVAFYNDYQKAQYYWRKNFRETP